MYFFSLIQSNVEVHRMMSHDKVDVSSLQDNSFSSDQMGESHIFVTVNCHCD